MMGGGRQREESAGGVNSQLGFRTKMGVSTTFRILSHGSHPPSAGQRGGEYGGKRGKVHSIRNLVFGG